MSVAHSEAALPPQRVDHVGGAVDSVARSEIAMPPQPYPDARIEATRASSFPRDSPHGALMHDTVNVYGVDSLLVLENEQERREVGGHATLAKPLTQRFSHLSRPECWHLLQEVKQIEQSVLHPFGSDLEYRVEVALGENDLRHRGPMLPACVHDLHLAPPRYVLQQHPHDPVQLFPQFATR